MKRKSVICVSVMLIFLIEFSNAQYSESYNKENLDLTSIFTNDYSKYFETLPETEESLSETECEIEEFSAIETIPSEFLPGEIAESAVDLSTVPKIYTTWKEIGPTEDPFDATNYIGRIDYIAFPDPSDNNNVFACSPTGGLFHSTDGGDSWFNAGTDKLPLCGVSCVAFDENNFNNIWYIATGSAHSYITLPQVSLGVYRTVNSGASWDCIGLENDLLEGTVPDCNSHHQINKVLQIPGEPGHLLVAATDGLWETINALDGTSYGNINGTPLFEQVVNDHCFDIEIIPNTNEVIVTTTGWHCSDTLSPNRLVIYKYDWETGITTTKSDSRFYYEGKHTALSAAISHVAPSIVFLLESESGPSNDNNPWRSELFRYDLTTDIITDMGQVGYTTPDAIEVSPNNPDSLWYGTNYYDQWYGAVCVSNAFTSPPLSNNGHSGTNNMHVDVNSIVYTSDGKELWVGTDGGVSKSTDGGKTWLSKNNGLGVATLFHMDISNTNPFKVLHGNQDCGVELMDKSSGNWISELIEGGDGGYCVFDYNDPNHFYYNIADGSIVEYYSNQKIHYFPYGRMVLNSQDPNIVYLSCGADGLKRITESSRLTGTPELWSNFPGVTDQSTGTVAVSKNPAHSNYIYVGWAGGTEDENKIFKSTVGGGNDPSKWTAIVPPDSINVKEIGKWNNIIVDYYDPDHIWVGNGWHGVYSVNTITNTWERVSAVPYIFNTMIQDKMNYGLYFSCADGVYYLENGATNLVKYDGDLPNISVRDIKINYITMQIVAGTLGRGVWAAPLDCSYSGYDLNLTGTITNTYKNAVNNINCYGTVANSAHVFLRAGNKIEFKPGFNTSDNCIMNAYVLACGTTNTSTNTKSTGDNYEAVTKVKGGSENEMVSTEPLFQVFPNPTKEYFYIHPKDYNGQYSFSLYDLQGKIVLDGKDYIGNQNINVFYLSKGYYLLRIVADNKVYIERILIE